MCESRTTEHCCGNEDFVSFVTIGIDGIIHPATQAKALASDFRRREGKEKVRRKASERTK